MNTNHDWVWLTTSPTKTGWYWYRSGRTEQKCIFVEMHPTLGAMMRDGRLPAIAKTWPGEWCGPIPEPRRQSQHLKLIREMLEAWEDQFGENTCDCQPELENQGHVCVWCKARFVLGRKEE